jgi:glutathione S-transferase
MLRLLGRSSSLNVRKVLWLCAELKLPYEQELWGAGFQPTSDPAFLALNPNAMVPVVIEDDGFTLWESNAICRYLAGRHGREDLLPADLRARANIERWMDWQAGDLNMSWRYAFMALVRKKPGFTDAAAVAASAAEWNLMMGILDARLSDTGAYAAGPVFTLADICLGLATHRWFMTPIERPALQAVEAYYDRLTERPGYWAHRRNGTP